MENVIPDRIKQELFQAVAMLVLLYDCTIWTNETLGEKARLELYKHATCWIEQIQEAATF